MIKSDAHAAASTNRMPVVLWAVPGGGGGAIVYCDSRTFVVQIYRSIAADVRIQGGDTPIDTLVTAAIG